MADEVQGPVIVWSGDPSKLKAAAKEGDQAIVDFAKSAKANLAGVKDAGEKSFDALQKRVQKLGSELMGNVASSKLNELSMALDKVGGAGKLTGVQLDNLVSKIRALESAGGKVPANLAQITLGYQQATVEGSKAAAAARSLAETKLSGFVGEIGGAGKALSALGPIGIAVAAGIGAALVGVKAYIDLTSAAAKWANETRDVATATGMTTDAVQRLQFAVAAAGQPFEGVTAAIVRMQKELVEFPGKFERLGLSVQQLRAMSPEEAFQKVGKALASIQDPALRSAISMEVFGKRWSELAPTLLGGLDAMKQATVVPQEVIDKLDELNGANKALGLEWEKLKISFAGALVTPETIDSIKQLTIALGALAKWVNEHGADVRMAVKAIANPAGLAQDVIEGQMRRAASVGPGVDNTLAILNTKTPAGLLAGGRPAIESGGLKPRTEAQQKVFEESQKALAEAIAATLPPLEEEIGKIQAKTKAQIEAAKGDEESIDNYRKAEAAEIAAARRKNDLKIIQEALTEQQRVHGEAVKEGQALVDQLGASESKLSEATQASISPLAEKIQKLRNEADAQATAAMATYVRKLRTGEATAEDEKNRDAIIANANATAEASEKALIETDAKKQSIEADKVLRSAEVALSAARAHGSDTLALQKQKIDDFTKSQQAQTQVQIDALVAAQKDIDKSDLDAEAKERLKAALEQMIAKLREAQGLWGQAGNVEKQDATLKALSKTLGGISQDVTAAKGLFEAFGMSADSSLSKVLAGVAQLANAGQGFVTSMASGNIFGMISSALQGVTSIVTTIKSLFGKSEEDKIADELGTQFGHKFDAAVSKAIAETEQKKGVGRAIAELLNLDKIMADGNLDPSKFAGKIGELLNAVKLGAIDTKDGVDQLSKAFTALQTAAEGGSVESEAAMIAMIQRARELQIAIPALDEAVKALMTDAVKQLKDIYAGQAEGAGGKDQAYANQVLFDAVSQGLIASEGLVQATVDMKDDLDAIAKANGERGLSGNAAAMQQMQKLLEDPNFKGAATGSSAISKLGKDLLDSGNMSQGTLDALETTSKTYYDQALDAASKQLNNSDAQKAALEASLPALEEMQRAQALGLKLSPDMQNMLTAASTAGILPAKDVMLQQLDVQRQIRDGIFAIAHIPAPKDGSGPSASPTPASGGPPTNYPGPAAGGIVLTPKPSAGYSAPGPANGSYTTAAKGLAPTRLSADTFFQAHAGELVLIVPKDQRFVSAATGFGQAVNVSTPGPYTGPGSVLGPNYQGGGISGTSTTGGTSTSPASSSIAAAVSAASQAVAAAIQSTQAVFAPVAVVAGQMASGAASANAAAQKAFSDESRATRDTLARLEATTRNQPFEVARALRDALQQTPTPVR